MAASLAYTAFKLGQRFYLLVAYAQEYLRERASRRAMQSGIGQELKRLCAPQTALTREMVDLVKAMDERSCVIAAPLTSQDEVVAISFNPPGQ